MNRLATTLVGFVIVLHLCVFVVEAFLWMQPGIHQLAVSKLNHDVAFEVRDQALILRKLFVSQGFYNLFLSLSGICGLTLLGKGRASAGYALVRYVCFSAVGAGVVLAFTSKAYFGAVLQAVPAAIALTLLSRSSSAEGSRSTKVLGAV
jgi:putative membrane protein